MRNPPDRPVSLQVPLASTYLPIVTAVAEKATLSMGLGQAEALSMTLAAEEIFSYLCNLAPPREELRIQCLKGGYYVKMDFVFAVENFDMGAFNLTAQVSTEDESSLVDLGLLIASRSLDHFKVAEERGREIRLTLIKDKRYPIGEAESVPRAERMEEFSIHEPSPAQVKVVALLVNQHYLYPRIPDFFQYPGKTMDMVQAADYSAAVALDPRGRVGGGIFWHESGSKTVECFGPYLFNQGSGSPMASALLEACIHAIAKTRAVGLINRFSTEDLPKDHFEALGELTHRDKAGSSTPMPIYFRQLEEDAGAFMWCHPQLEGFLRGQYERLVLPRDLLEVKDSGESRPRRSVIFAEFSRGSGLVTLRPIRAGMDEEENIKAHIGLLSKESAKTILFEMDLGVAWHTEFTPALVNNGFSPRIILPYAGEGDMVVFQWDGSDR